MEPRKCALEGDIRTSAFSSLSLSLSLSLFLLPDHHEVSIFLPYKVTPP
jgi:hypothetical protein